MASLAPDARRARAARAAGLQARGPRLVLVPLALSLAWWVEEVHVQGLAEWLAARLAAVFVERVEPRALAASLASLVSPLLLVLAAASVLALVLVRGRARLDPPIRPLRGMSSLVRVGLLASAVVLLAWLGLPLLAAASRVVDASGSAMLAAWCAWLRRGLLGLLVAGLVLGVVERLLAARRLWLALHLDPAQARALHARERAAARPFSRSST
jgi:hypothetical protein